MNHMTTSSFAGGKKSFAFRRHALRGFLLQQILVLQTITEYAKEQKSMKVVINNTPRKLHHAHEC